MKFLCYKCTCNKEQEEFYPSSIKKQDYICRLCSRINNSAQRKDRASKNDIKQRFSYAKSSAKGNGKPFLLSFEEYKSVVIQNCYYCDRPSGGLGVGLDRIDNDKSIGYTLENILPCCSFCNRIRNNLLTVEETKVAIKAIMEFRKQNVVL